MSDDSKLPKYQQLLNKAYDSPFLFVAALGVPLATGILFQQLQKKNITLSQRILHSRVFAQSGVLGIFMATMFFVDYMRRHGKFRESDAIDEMVEEMAKQNI